MILEFTTETGSTFRLDKELMRWDRHVDKRSSHGQLYWWPTEVSIGQHVTIYDVDPVSKCGKSFTTAKVISMSYINRDEPEMADASGAN